jgi:hypothetical protein
MFKKVFVFGILIALVLASFPTLGVLAGGPGPSVVKMEAEWDKYVTAVNKMALTHSKADFIAEEWLGDHKDASARNKTELQNALTGYHQNLDAAKAIIQQHNGLDAKGNVVEVAAASKSVKHLGEHLALLRGYWHTMTNLDTHLIH